jgi:microsomal dipeptidase-like Zn-dependent dipeptidase/D-alanyl-D-alanine carboxypeptidase
VQPAAAKDAPSALAKVLAPAIEHHRGDVGLAVKHLTTGESFSYKADRPMPTASLIKFPVMIATYQAAADGKVSLDDMLTLEADDRVGGSGVLTRHFSPGTELSLRDAVRLMIAQSDNTATNLVIDKIGLPTTNQCLDSLGCPETRLNSKVFRRDTSIAPERSREFGLGSTTAAEMIRLLEQLHSREMVDEKASDQMLEHLFACEDKIKVPRFLPSGTRLAHKTGSVSATRTDAGIMETPAGPIAYAILTNNNQDRGWNDDNEGDLFCAQMGKAIYQYFNTRGKAASAPVARVLGVGSDGDLVEALQRTLNARIRPSLGIGVDGDFGPETESAVKKFQEQQSLPVTGVVDADTWKALGALVTDDEPAPEPAVVNAASIEKLPLEPLDGPPVVTCKAWAIADGQTGELLAGFDEDEPRDPASTTKIMTALVVTRLAEADPTVLDEVVTFSERADATSGSTADLKAGERLPVGELLYGLLLPSGNDASVALAEHFGARLAAKKGSGTFLSDAPRENANAAGDKKEPDPYECFIAAMNRQAAELGMTKTRYKNPHGLTSDGHVTTARDMTRLAFAAMQRPEFRRRVSTMQHGATVDSVSGYRRNVVWRATNQLLRREGYDGVKTGTTGRAGCCLVSTAERDGRRLLVVVLGSTSTESRYADTRNLFRWAWTDLVGISDQAHRAGNGEQGAGTVVASHSSFLASRPSPTATRPPVVLTDHARELHGKSLVIDGHNDMPWEIRDKGSSDFSKLDISKPQPTLQTDIPRLRAGGVGAQFWSVWVPVDFGYRGTALGTTLEQIELVKLMVARYPETFSLAMSTDDVERIHAEGKIASLIGVEGGHCIEESLNVLGQLYKAGARYMTLTHSDTLPWADSGTDENRHGGLTPFGEEVVRAMNRLGMLVDISHVSPETMHDVLDVTKAPVIFSHSSARAVADHPRNVPDDVLRRLRDQDGVVMVNFFSAFIVPEAAAMNVERMAIERKFGAEYERDRVRAEMNRLSALNPYPRGTIHDLVDHIDHIARVAGVEHVGLGSDFDGVSVLPEQLDDVSYYPYITQALIDRGYSDAEIQGILGGNLMRVFRAAEAYAAGQRQAAEP